MAYDVGAGGALVWASAWRYDRCPSPAPIHHHQPTMGNKNKRFEVCSFPSYHGTPWKTDFYLIALGYALMRLFSSLVSGVVEIRVVDTKRDNHIIVW